MHPRQRWRSEHRNVLKAVMAFLFYFAVLIAVAASSLFGLDQLTSPLPTRAPNSHVASTASPPNKLAQRRAEPSDAMSQGDARRSLSPIYPANPAGTKDHPPQVLAKNTADSASAAIGGAPAPARNSGASTEPKQLHEPVVADPKREEPPPLERPGAQAALQQNSNRCDVRTCSAAYASFRQSDCTYQPFEGPRRLCLTPSNVRSSKRARQREIGGYRDRGAAPPAIIGTRELSADEQDYDGEDRTFMPWGGHGIVIERSYSTGQ